MSETASPGNELDVVVAGGGPAGLQAALVLGRARRSVLVADGGAPRNAPAVAVHNLVGHEGIAPGEWLAAAHRDVARYGVRRVAADVVGGQATDGRIAVRLADGSSWRARALLLATGLVEELPAVAGIERYWGRDVVACPYCHGWEATDRPVAVLGAGPRAWQQVLLMRRFTRDLVLLANGSPELTEDQLAYLDRVGVPVRTDPVARVRGTDRLSGVVFASGDTMNRAMLVVTTRRRQRSGLAAALGCQLDGDLPVISADPAGRTTVPGVWAVGSAVEPSLTVIGAAGRASSVAIELNNALLADDVAAEIAERGVE